VTVDSKGWSALARELDATLERIKKIEDASRRRLQKAEPAGKQEATVVMMLFNSPSRVHGDAAAPDERHAGRRRRRQRD
jgi:hypothetical protein